jgi:hypothetical protein
MDADMNKYDLNHRVAHHGTMSDREWEDAYRLAWDTFYTPEHINTMMRRICANKRGRPRPTLLTILWFYLTIRYEGVHPLEGGALRLKFRRDRRRGLPIESALVFYPRYWLDTARKAYYFLRGYLTTRKMLNAALKAPDRWTYSDLAIAPPKADEFDVLDLYHATSGGEDELARKRRADAIRGGSRNEAAEAAAVN